MFINKRVNTDVFKINLIVHVLMLNLVLSMIPSSILPMKVTMSYIDVPIAKPI